MRRRLFSSFNKGIPFKGAVARGADTAYTLEPLILSKPRIDEVVVRVVSTGICHTDIFTKTHGFCPFPSVLGHEGAG